MSDKYVYNEECIKDKAKNLVVEIKSKDSNITAYLDINKTMWFDKQLAINSNLMILKSKKN